MGVRGRPDLSDITQTGWGVIFAESADPSVREALSILLDRRRFQAGELYREFSGSAGYIHGETKESFLRRHGAPLNDEAEPNKVPYYLLLVGSPSSIPYSFQAQLDTQYGVGRIYFETLEEYTIYATSVVQTEESEERNGFLLPRSAALLHTASAPAAAKALESLSSWLCKKGKGWTASQSITAGASKESLSETFTKAQSHPLIVISSRGIALPPGSPLQTRYQGALICDGGIAERAGHSTPAISHDQLFSFLDLPRDANFRGSIIFLHSDFSLGSAPDSLRSLLMKGTADESLTPPAIAKLPQKLLANPSGGALAVLGYCGPISIEASFRSEGNWQAFEEFTRFVANSRALGDATEPFGLKYADRATDIVDRLREEREWGFSDSAYRLWTQIIPPPLIFGDPFVHLPVQTQISAFPEAIPPRSQPSRPASTCRISLVPGATNDQVGDKDQLGLSHYIDAFVKLIKSIDTTPPITIGIFGAWGSGKSFILKNISASLDNRQLSSRPEYHKVHVVNFDAWEYSSHEVMWPGLAHEIIAKLDKAERHKFRRLLTKLRLGITQDKLRSGLAFIFFLVSLGALVFRNTTLPWSTNNTIVISLPLLLGIASLFRPVKEALSNPASEWLIRNIEYGYGKPIEHMKYIKADLGSLEKSMSERGERVLVTIDDLDRCSPNKIVQVLEAAKLLLNFKSFVICLAADARVLVNAIEQEFKGALNYDGRLGYEYLDKIIQIPFRIPQPTPAALESFMLQQLGRLEILDGEAPPTEPFSRDKSGEGVPIAWPEPIVVEEIAGAILDPLDSPTAESFTRYEWRAFQTFVPFLRPNPRHLKRLINVYRLVRSLGGISQEEVILQRPEAVVRWLIMSAQWPYHTALMLRQFDEVGADAIPPGVDLLSFLLEQVQHLADPERAARLDDSVSSLFNLLTLEEGRVTARELKIVRRYTMNFDPFVEDDLVSSKQRELMQRSQSPSAETETGPVPTVSKT